MAKTTAEDLKKRYENEVDLDYQSRLYRQIKYAFGEKWDDSKPRNAGEGRYPDFQDVTPNMLKVGNSRRILNAQFINMSRSMYTLPMPEFPQLDKYTAEARRQFWARRARGNGHADGHWSIQLQQAFMHGDGVGVGFVMVALRTNPETGYQYVDLMHVPAYNVMWDRYVSSPSRARWISFVLNYPVDLAEARFGVKAVKDKITPMVDAGGKRFDRVRVFEYFDVGMGKSGTPTRATHLGTFEDKPVEITENEFECLPFAHYEHFIAPGMRRPMGRIAIQMESQEALNEVETRMRQIVKQGRILGFVNKDAVDEDDFKKVEAGAWMWVRIAQAAVAAGAPAGAFQNFELPNTLAEWQAILERQAITDSGVTEADAGNYSDTARTATENNILDQRSQVQQSWSRGQAAQFYQRAVERVFYVARMFDKDPVELSIFDRVVPFNVPKKPGSSVKELLAQESPVLIDEQDLLYGDAQRKQSVRLSQLTQIAELAGQLQLPIDPQWMARELLKAIGEKDLEAALRAIDPAMMGAAPPGTPPLLPPPALSATGGYQ